MSCYEHEATWRFHLAWGRCENKYEAIFPEGSMNLPDSSS